MRGLSPGWVLDVGLAVFLALAGARYAHNGPGSPMAGTSLDMLPAAALGVLAAAPLALRRRYPLPVLWAVTLVSPLLHATNPDEIFVGCLALGTALYSAAAYDPRRLATLASLPVPAALLVVLFRNAALPDLPRAWLGVVILVPIAVAAAGIQVRRGREERDRERRAREQAAALREALGRERATIARELHDVVTHHVSLMVIQAGAARVAVDAAPEEAREALRSVEAAGRTALGELRGVLGLLAADATARLDPQPGLAALPALVAGVRDSGVPVELTIDGEPRPVPEGIGLTAYRVVQEALTNTVKHAAGASARVVVEYAGDRLRVEVTDTGTDAPPAGDGAGYGLIGLRERVAVYGGTLQAGPRLPTGYRVRALLPLGAP